MRDAIDMQLWADHHESFTREVTRLFRRLGRGFAILQRHLYAAPWKTRVQRQGASRRDAHMA